jgi:shikimate dehydrogenase
MHNAAAAALGLDLVSVPLPVRPPDVAAAVRGLPALGFLGANVTVPHKQAVIPFLDEIHPAALAIGAVNTIVIGGSLAAGEQPAEADQLSAVSDHSAEPAPRALLGYNTDWSGFLADLETLGMEVANQECVVLGAGGSARAVVYALHAAGGRVHLFARRPEQAQELAADLGVDCRRRSLAELEAVNFAGEI